MGLVPDDLHWLTEGKLGEHEDKTIRYVVIWIAILPGVFGGISRTHLGSAPWQRTRFVSTGWARERERERERQREVMKPVGQEGLGGLNKVHIPEDTVDVFCPGVGSPSLSPSYKQHCSVMCKHIQRDFIPDRYIIYLRWIDCNIGRCVLSPPRNICTPRRRHHIPYHMSGAPRTARSADGACSLFPRSRCVFNQPALYPAYRKTVSARAKVALPISVKMEEVFSNTDSLLQNRKKA